MNSSSTIRRRNDPPLQLRRDANAAHVDHCHGATVARSPFRRYTFPTMPRNRATAHEWPLPTAPIPQSSP